MQAVIQPAYGPPDALRVAEVERPRVEGDEVLIAVHAAGVERGAWHLTTGLPYLVRLAGYGLRRPRSLVAGTEVAGHVEAVGPEVTRFAPGDEVFGACQGAFAQYARGREDGLARKPGNVSFEAAATMPVSGLTALQALRDGARVRPGQRVLVLGASGGVGTFAVQIADAMGAHVAGVCSAPKLALVRSLGAAEVFDYATDELRTTEARFDAILDLGGNRPLRELRRLLTADGTLVIAGGEGGGRWLGGTDRQVRALLLSPFLRQRLRPFLSTGNADDLDQLAWLAETGRLTPVVGRTYPLSDAAEALGDLAAGRLRGKAVIAL